MDYTGQTWFDETKSWNDNYKAFLETQKVETYTLGDFTGTPEGDQTMYTDLKIKSTQETEKIKAFYVLRDEAFKQLAIAQDAERQALGVTWQGYEDNNYTVG